MIDRDRRSDPILDRVRDPFFALDDDWRFTYLNEGAEALLEASREQLLGRVMWDEFPETVEAQFPETVETQFPDGFYRAMDEQVPVSFDVYHASFDTWFEARAFPSESGLSVYVRDVTERRNRETELAQHGAVVEAIDDCVVTLDRENHVASVNSAVERAFDVDREALIGEHVEMLPEVADIDDETTMEIGRAIGDLSVGNATSRTIEVPFTDGNGTDRVGELRLVPVDDGTVSVAGVIRDVTDQHEYERIVTSLHEITRWLFQSDDPEEICAIAVHAGSDLLDLPISGVWLLDDEHGYLDPVAGTAGAHDEFGGLPRYQPGEGLVWDVFEGGEPRIFDDLDDQEGVYNPDTPLRSEIIAPIGTRGILMTGAFEPGQFDETDLDLVSTLVENTRAALQRADRERVLQDRTERLRRQTDRLQAIAAVLSGELSSQLGELEAALEDDETPPEWEFPLAEDTVETTLDRAERLVDDVREFARNATDVGPRTRIDLRDAIDRAVETSTIEDAAVVVVEEPATLRADPERFDTMLGTIFDDAAARSNGDVTVQVGLLGVSERADGSRGFFVLDDASEIPPAAHERALDLQVDADGSTTTREAMGDVEGLGLAVARAIAEAHDWTASVSNGENGGTHFAVRDVTTLERAG